MKSSNDASEDFPVVTATESFGFERNAKLIGRRNSSLPLEWIDDCPNGKNKDIDQEDKANDGESFFEGDAILAVAGDTALCLCGLHENEVHSANFGKESTKGN